MKIRTPKEIEVFLGWQCICKMFTTAETALLTLQNAEA